MAERKLSRRRRRRLRRQQHGGTACDATERSWSSLPVDLAGVVLRGLTRHVDRVRFGAVCREWRGARQFPWIALPDRTFYSLPGSAFRPLPLHLDCHRQLPHAQSACGEWLVFERQDGAITLVSPFSAAADTMVLPGLHTIRPRDEPFRDYDMQGPPLRKLVVCSANLVDEGRRKLALCRPGAASWSLAANANDIHLMRIEDIVFDQGKLYALNGCRGLFSVSIVDEDDQGAAEPTVSQVDRVIKNPRHWSVWPHYLVESGGALLLIRRHSCTNLSRIGRPLPKGLDFEMATRFQVFMADFEQSRWTTASGVGDDRVLFVGRWCSRTVRVLPDQQRDDYIDTGKGTVSSSWKTVTPPTTATTASTGSGSRSTAASTT